MRSRLIAPAALTIALCGASASELHAGTLILEPVQSSGPGTVSFFPDPPITNFFNGITTVFEAVGTFRSTFLVGHDPDTTLMRFGFETGVRNVTPFDFADVLFSIDDPEGRGVTVDTLGFHVTHPSFCQPPPGVFLGGTVSCAGLTSEVEGLVSLEVPDPGPGGTYAFSLLQTAVPIEAAPEPGAFGLLVFGLLAALALAQTRHRSAAS